jgi:DNA repair photolyase
MRRFTGHNEAWGEFVDAKVNAANLLKTEVKNKEVGKVWISGVCDAYQPLEKKYELTKRCLEILLKHDWPVTVQTKSSLVLRDTKLLEKFGDTEVGLTVTTADEKIRQKFENRSPSIHERIDALEKLHLAEIKTFAMIAPILPKAEGLAEQLRGKVDYVLIDRMNYHYADWVYRKYNLNHAITEAFFAQKKTKLAELFEKNEISCQVLF